MNERQLLILEILHLAYLVHEKTKYIIMLNFSGHVDKIDISIRTSKDDWRETVMETEFYTIYKKHFGDGTESHIARLKAKITVLKQILNDGEIDYDELDYEEIYMRDYKF